ncbi:cilia- and flagella-associated protein 36 isoform X2 [Gouania willdenowi]|uniref:Cilia- and flagella-associated protein 36 n=1 Tax=Gouania willdenowi TaxID=441366 RepID=A0A8C5GY83_GOUWI|nr:cilia- and flagella-associated protein 36 isoform X2 [Gouania willdenowi]
MAEDDSEWVVESIVGYLGSPEWLIPVTDFMENKCTVFDDEDENKLSYTEIHESYKSLVEKLLENYMQEVGINEEQFLDACTSPFAKSKTLQAVFQPVLATDDFEVFRSLMVQKNMELQLQALRVIKERNGALPECLTDGVDVMTELQQQEMKILQEVLKRSKEEYDQELSRRLLEEDFGATSSSRSLRKLTTEGEESQITTSTPSQHNDGAKVSPVRDEVMEMTTTTGSGVLSSFSLKPTSECISNGAAEPTVLPAVRPIQPTINSQAAAKAWLEEAHREAGFSKPYTELSESQQEQLQQRAAYLRQQRDKLHALKKEQQKTKYTAKPEEAPPTTTTTNTTTTPTQDISAEEKKKLQKRKHLAEKLKEEVIKK